MTLRDIKPQTKLPFHGVILPTISISNEDRVLAGATVPCTNLQFMTQLCRNGWKVKVANRIPKEQQQVYADRIKLELDTIEALGFTNYILMVWDICRFADEQKIPRGPGRGSVSSSLVCNLLNITDVDPIENGLFFTRFLSKSRAKTSVVDGVTYVDGGLVADIDMDYCFYRRQEVIDYINQRYPGQTAKLLTTQSFTSRMLMKDVLKVYEGLHEDIAKEVSGIIEDDTGNPVSIERSMFGDEKHQKGQESDWEPNERFVEWAAAHSDSVEIAMDLEGLNHAEGMHASAVAICAMPIRQLMPLQLSSSKDAKVEITGYDMYDAQEIALKFDILGLKALSILEDCGKALGLDWRKIDIHDPCIYASLQDFKLRYGIFQLETWAQGSAAAKVKPRNFDQLASVLAIARPGAIDYLQQFADYVNLGAFKSIHPLIDDILKPTGGVCVYQEQFLAMLVKVGLTPDEAEAIRKIVGKKLKEKVPEAKAKIAEVCKRNGHPPEIVDLLLKIAEDSGGYQFAAAHSVAYAKITAYTLWVKAKHPLVFFWANLQMVLNESEKYEKLAVIEQEMTAYGFKLLPPHFNHSDLGFKIEGQGIRFALGMIRGVSSKNVEKLNLFRAEAGTTATKFQLFQAIKNAGLNVGIGSALIQAGCMDGYDQYANADGGRFGSRSRLVLEYSMWSKSDLLNDKERANCLLVGKDLDWDVLRAVKHLTETNDEKGKPLIKATRFETIKKRYAPYKEIYLLNSRNERLANFFYERRTLGYSYSEKLRDIYSEHIDGLVTVEEAKKLPVKSTCRLIGFVKQEPHRSKTKKGNWQLKLHLGDNTGEVIVKAFNDMIAQIEEQNGRLPEEDDMLVVNARLMEGGTLFAVNGPDGCAIAIQTAHIYTKLSELKDAKAEKESAAT